MHILLIHQAFTTLDEPGGTRHHEFARELVEKGYQVTVITSPVSYLTGAARLPALSLHPEVKIEQEGVRILSAYTYPALHKSFIHRVFAFISFMTSSFFIGLKVRHVDLVWGTSPPIFQGVTAWLLARFKRVPFLFEVRDLWPTFAIAVGVLQNSLLIKLSFWLEHFLYRHADQVVVNSPGYVAHVLECGASSVELIPNGADPEMFDPAGDGHAFRSANHLENKFVVLYAGAHGMSNDLDVVLEAAELLQRWPGTANIAILLLGDGKEKPVLQEEASRMHLDNVMFLPPVPKKDMGEALACADACLAILKPLEEYKTTYPNKVFDYMAAGRPVVLAIDGVIRQVIEAAGCGYYVQPGNSLALAKVICQLAEDKTAAKEMGLRGRQYLEEHFSRAIIAAKLIQVIQQLAS